MITADTKHREPVTGETITDAEIRELRDTPGRDEMLAAYCAAALFNVPPRTPNRAFRLQRRAEARARCAEILNERAKESA